MAAPYANKLQDIRTDFTRQTITHKIIRSDAHHQGVILVLIEQERDPSF